MVRHVRRDGRLTCRPEHPRATGRAARRVQDPDRGSARRVRYLLCGLLVLPVLTAGGLYLARGFGPAPLGRVPEG